MQLQSSFHQRFNRCEGRTEKMAMPKTQQYVLQAGGALIFLMFFYPPWLYVDEHKVGHSMGYSPIWKAPTEKTTSLTVPIQTANNIDFNILFLQGALLCVMAVGACFVLQREPDKSVYARK